MSRITFGYVEGLLRKVGLSLAHSPGSRARYRCYVHAWDDPQAHLTLKASQHASTMAEHLRRPASLITKAGAGQNIGVAWPACIQLLA